MSGSTAVRTPARTLPRPVWSRRRRLGTWSAAAATAGVVVLVVALHAGGGAPAPAADGLPTAGAVTGWGLPLLRWMVDVLAMATIGTLLAAGVLLPPERDGLTARSLRLVQLGSRLALAWAAAAAVSIVFTFSDFVGTPLRYALDPVRILALVRDVTQGRALAGQVLVGLLVALACRYAVRRGPVLLLLAAALVGVVLPGVTGHSGAANDHMLAESSLVVHVVAASLWVGGLIALAVLATAGVEAMAVAVPRFSALALWCVVALGLSGVLNAWVRLGAVSPLVTSPYGHLVIAKASALAVLAGFGAWHRSRTVPALVGSRAWIGFARIAAVETVVMVSTVALAVALSRSPTPVPEDRAAAAVSPARELLGYALPPAPTPLRLLLDIRLDGFMLTGALLAAALYVTGVLVLRRRGDRWAPGRSAAWLAGIALLVVTTNGGLGRYSPVLFSAHMAQHMILNMAVPILLVLGAPFTLAVRALQPAAHGGIGLRETLLSIVHSRFVGVVSHPLVAAAIFISSLYGLYFSPLFPAAMGSHWGHLLMQLHFLGAGLLFFWVLIGVDPGPRRPPYLARIVLLFAVMGLHAFFSVALLSSKAVLAEAYFASLHRSWGGSLLDDQHLGGGIGWAFGELPIVVVLAALFVSWLRTDAREAARYDRTADRDGDAALAAANAQLARLAGRDRQ